MQDYLSNPEARRLWEPRSYQRTERLHSLMRGEVKLEEGDIDELFQVFSSDLAATELPKDLNQLVVDLAWWIANGCEVLA